MNLEGGAIRLRILTGIVLVGTALVHRSSDLGDTLHGKPAVVVALVEQLVRTAADVAKLQHPILDRAHFPSKVVLV